MAVTEVKLSQIAQKLLDIRKGGQSDGKIDRQEEVDAFRNYAAELKKSGKLKNLTKEESLLYLQNFADACVFSIQANNKIKEDILSIMKNMYNRDESTTSLFELIEFSMNHNENLIPELKKIAGSDDATLEDIIVMMRKSKESHDSSYAELLNLTKGISADKNAKFDTVEHQRETLKYFIETQMNKYNGAVQNKLDVQY